MAEIIKLGSLYFDGQPQETGARYDGGRIMLGAAIPDKELQWIKANGLLIADQCVCTCVSWEQLDDQDLVFGTPIQIDGQFYLCRCLKVGSKEGDPNEWDAILDETDKSNDLWHWEDIFFWGQETPAYLASDRAVRGCCSARVWISNRATHRHVGVGFRPALELLGSEPCSPDTLIGKTIRLYGSGWSTLGGRLLSADDYDLMLKHSSPIPDDCPWVSKSGDNLVVDRASVLWLKEA